MICVNCGAKIGNGERIKDQPRLDLRIGKGAKQIDVDACGGEYVASTSLVDCTTNALRVLSAGEKDLS